MNMWLLALLLSVTVASGPTLIEKPVDVTVDIGDTVTLKCVVGGERKPEFVLHSIQWVDQTNGRTINTFRDGRTVTDQYAERFAIVGDTSRGEWHLRISHVTPADNGRYACQLHSGNGDAAADILVRVEPQSVKLSGTDRNGELAHAMDVENDVQCQSIMSRPAPTIKFVIRNEEVDPVYEQQSVCNPSTGFCNTTAVLSFTPMSSDPQPIICRVYHNEQQYKEVKTLSHVFTKPTVNLIVPESATELEQVELKCDATGHPYPSQYYWSINNGAEEASFGPTRVITVERDTTTAKKSQMIVLCRVETHFNGDVYTQQETKSISVYWGPVSRLHLPQRERIEIDEGDTYSMGCSFDGFPAPSITWVQYSSRVGVERATTPNHVIKSASGQDIGEWECTALNAKTGKTEQRTVILSVRQRPQIYSDKLQIDDVDAKPQIRCEFKWSFSSGETFKRLSWSKLVKIDDNEKRQILPGLNDIRTIESGVLQTSVDSKYTNRFTNYNPSSDEYTAVALLTINEDEDKDASYVCSVENSVGRTERTFRLRNNPLTAETIIILGSVIGCLFVVFLIGSVVIYHRRVRTHHPGTQGRKRTPDITGPLGDVKHTTGIPPAFSHSLSHREDAEINVSRSDLNQSNPSSRNWEKPSSTYSGPDDGYSTERGAGDCGGSAKAESNKRRNQLETSEPFESCLSYVNENRAQSERFYSTLQPGQGYFQQAMGKGSIRPHSATPYQQSLRQFDDIEITDRESSGTSSDTSNSNQPLLHESANVFLQQGTLHAQPRLATRTISHV